MKCEECKNYEAKEKPQRVTVLTFDRDGKQGSYEVDGPPDWARIERETIGAGMMAVIVKNSNTNLEGSYTPWAHAALYSWCLHLGIEAARRHAPEMNAALGTRWDYFHDEDLRKAITDIQSAIAAWRAKQPGILTIGGGKKYDYKPGDRIILVDDKNACIGLRHTSIEEVELVRVDTRKQPGEVWFTEYGYLDWSYMDQAYELQKPCWIAKPVKAEAKPWAPQVGEKVWWDGVQVLDGGSSRQAESPGVYTLNKTPQTCNIAWRVGYRLAESYHWTTLDHLRPASEAPEHYDGEPFMGSRSAHCMTIYPPDKYRLEFTGEKRAITKAEDDSTCFLSPDDNGWARRSHGACYGGVWILRAVPVEAKPVWKVGEMAYDTSLGRIVFVGEFNGEKYSVTHFPDNTYAGYVSPSALRPLEPADWTREIGGVKMRAYESGSGFVRLTYTNGPVLSFLPGSEGDKIIREFCAAKGLPVMPFALHKGDMKAPE